jgi:hypothetical protein
LPEAQPQLRLRLSYEHEERIAIATEAGVPEQRALEIATCEVQLAAGETDRCRCGAHEVQP